MHDDTDCEECDGFGHLDAEHAWIEGGWELVNFTRCPSCTCLICHKPFKGPDGVCAECDKEFTDSPQA